MENVWDHMSSKKAMMQALPKVSDYETIHCTIRTISAAIPSPPEATGLGHQP